MKNGYKIEWTDNALSELKTIFEYLEKNWTEKELKKKLYEILENKEKNTTFDSIK